MPLPYNRCLTGVFSFGGRHGVPCAVQRLHTCGVLSNRCTPGAWPNAPDGASQMVSDEPCNTGQCGCTDFTAEITRLGFQGAKGAVGRGSCADNRCLCYCVLNFWNVLVITTGVNRPTGRQSARGGAGFGDLPLH